MNKNIINRIVFGAVLVAVFSLLLCTGLSQNTAQYSDGGKRGALILPAVTVAIPTNGTLPLPDATTILLDNTAATNISGFSGLQNGALYLLRASSSAVIATNGTTVIGTASVTLNSSKVAVLLATDTNKVVIITSGP